LFFVLVSLPKILKTPFTLAYSALTFPFVITAIALKQSAAFLAAAPVGSFISQAATAAMDMFAVAIVAYVMVRYGMFLLMAPASVAVPVSVEA
jgi:exfoliative toxin A/B